MIDNTKYEFNNNGILTSPVQAKVRMGYDLYNYAIELCHKLDMKVFKELSVVETWSNCNEFFTKSEYHKLASPPDKGKYTKGLALTYNGFINAVIWVKDIPCSHHLAPNQTKPTYFYNTSRPILEKGNRHVMQSVNLRPLIKKILDNRKPIEDERIMGLSKFTSHTMVDMVAGIESLQADYNRVELKGKHLHTALELAIGKGNHTTHGCDAYIQNKLHDTLDKFKWRWDKIEDAKKKIQDDLSQPFYMICHGMLHEENECIVLRCVKEQEIGKEDELKVLDIQYCKDIEDYKDYDSIKGLLTIFKVSDEDKARGRTRVDGFMNMERYTNYYNKDAKIGHIRDLPAKEDSHSSNVERLFILNMQ